MDNNAKNGWKAFSGSGFDRKAVLRRFKKAEVATTRHAHRFLVSRLDNARAVRKEVGVWMVLMGLMIAGMGVQFGFSQRGYMQQAPSQGGTYSEAVVGPVATLNPLYASSSAEVSFSKLAFSSLYDYDNTGFLRKDLATNLTIEQGGAVYKVDIRKDAKWSDGQPLTAKDVVFTINLIKNPATRSPLRVNWADVTAKAIGDYTVELKLPATYAAFPHALTFPVLPVHMLLDVNAGALRESAFSRNPIGSGPFVFKLLQQADTITNYQAIHLVANQKYYGGQAKLDQFELYAYANEDDIKVALQAGEVNGAAGAENIQAKDLGAIYNATNVPLASGVYALFNNGSPVLNDVRVRKALQIGTDMEKVRQAVGGRVLPLSLPFTDGQVPGVPMAPALNVAQAIASLDEAGWRLSDGVRTKEDRPLQLAITTTSDKQYVAAANELAKQWEALGVRVTVSSIDAASISAQFAQTVLQQRNFDVLVYELAIGADPDVYAYWHSSQGGMNIGGYNFANYSNKNADAALASARSRIDGALRNAKYVAFARQWLDDAPALGLYQPVLEYVVNKKNTAIINGAKLISPSDRYSNVLDWSVESSAVYKTP